MTGFTGHIRDEIKSKYKYTYIKVHISCLLIQGLERTTTSPLGKLGEQEVVEEVGGESLLVRNRIFHEGERRG